MVFYVSEGKLLVFKVSLSNKIKTADDFQERLAPENVYRFVELISKLFCCFSLSLNYCSHTKSKSALSQQVRSWLRTDLCSESDSSSSVKHGQFDPISMSESASFNLLWDQNSVITQTRTVKKHRTTEEKPNFSIREQTNYYFWIRPLFLMLGWIKIEVKPL